MTRHFFKSVSCEINTHDLRIQHSTIERMRYCTLTQIYNAVVLMTDLIANQSVSLLMFIQTKPKSYVTVTWCLYYDNIIVLRICGSCPTVHIIHNLFTDLKILCLHFHMTFLLIHVYFITIRPYYVDYWLYNIHESWMI